MKKARCFQARKHHLSTLVSKLTEYQDLISWLLFRRPYYIDDYLCIFLSMDNVFKALADQNRRKILDRLKQKDMSVSELLEHFHITQASLSHHLDILKRANLVIAERKGQFMYYSLNTSVFEEMLGFFMEMFGKKSQSL